jgi:hypothetical protein
MAMHVSSVPAPCVIRSGRANHVHQSHRRARLCEFIAEQPNLLQKTSREAATVALQYATDVECSSGLVEDASFHSQVKLADQAIHYTTCKLRGV